MTRRVHFAVEVLYGTLFQAACANAAGRDAMRCLSPVELTDDEAEVTCAKCLRALGYEPAVVLNLEPKELPNGRFQVAA
jgi:hypothetical protein